MQYVQSISDLSHRDRGIAGGKGASLGELYCAGVPVPQGVVVLTTAFDTFLLEHTLADTVMGLVRECEDVSRVAKNSQRIVDLFTQYEFPQEVAKELKSAIDGLDSSYFAVRSSATVEDGCHHAWAGQLDTFLGSSAAQVAEYTKHCWASLYSPHALTYRAQSGLLTTPISVAVVVQTLVPADVSGVAFTVHPVTEESDHILIEAAKGLGEALVGGHVTPDSYTISKSTKNLVDSYIGVQAKALEHVNGTTIWRELGRDEGSVRFLSDSEIETLREYVCLIEQHYTIPQDIEWVKAGNDFYIVQSRPITTLQKSNI